MDMGLHPPPVQPPSAADPSCPEPSRCFDSLYCNKFDGEDMFMSVSELVRDYTSSSDQDHQQVCPVPGLGDEDYDFPPITPPALPELSLAPLHESGPGAYHSPQCPPVAQSRRNGLHPFHSHRIDLPEVTIPDTLSQDGGPPPSFLSTMLHKAASHPSQCGTYPPMGAFRPSIQSVMVQQGQLTTINQSHLGLSGNNVPRGSPSPPGSKRATPSPSSSVHEDDANEALRGGGAEKRPASDMGKKPRVQKKKKKKDPNEPQKPVSAYALFFRDTQAAIKGQNPSATFGEVSKIVASSWDGLEEEQKQLYKRKTEVAKTEYLKQLAAYRANLVSQSYCELDDVTMSQGAKSPGFPRSGQANGGVYAGLSHPQQLHPAAPMPMHLPGANMTSLMPPSRANMAAQMPLPGANVSSPMPFRRDDSGLQTCLPGANMATSMPLPGANMAASSSPPLPTMQRCGSLQHQQQFTPMQMPLGNQHHHQLPFHPQSTPQGFTPPAEFHGMLHRMSTVGLPLTPPIGYIHSGCRGASPQGLDWSVDYCSNGTLQR